MLDKKGVGKRIAYYRKEHGMTQKDRKRTISSTLTNICRSHG